MAIQVERESITTKSRHVSPSYVDKDGNQFLTSSDRPFPIVDVNHLRLHEGRAYYTYYIESSLAVNANLDIAVAFPAGVTPHSVFNYNNGYGVATGITLRGFDSGYIKNFRFYGTDLSSATQQGLTA